VEVRVHGNHSVSDVEVLEIAAIAPGDPATDAALEAAARRLRESGRFEEVAVVRRYRGLSVSDRVAVIITVREKTPAAKKLLFLPLVRYVEEEGFSYGARVSAHDLLGAGEFLSLPLSWGGVRRAALEAGVPLAATRVAATVEIRQWENPHYELDDRRFRVGLTVARRLTASLRAAASVDRAAVAFGGLDESLWRFGTSVVLDTRPDRAFPWGGVLASAGWQRVEPGHGAGANRFRVEIAGYRRLLGAPVLAVRGVIDAADGPLPAYERPLLGGMDSLRGWEAGRFSGDNAAHATVELRVPLTAPTSVAHLGVTAFWDVGGVWDHGEALADTRFRHGVGVGAFLIAPVVRVSVAVGADLQGHARFHAGAGFTF
jgi:outer membrane protein assembly factor BamA